MEDAGNTRPSVWQRLRHSTSSWLLLFAGALLYSGGINSLVVANHLAEGGLSGIAILIHYSTGSSVGLLYLILNIPLLLFGWWKIGRDFTGRTVVGALATSAGLSLTSFLSFQAEDLLLVSLYAGGIMGIGIGLMFRSGGSSAGFDIIARYARDRWGFSLTESYFVLDAMVLATAAFSLGANGGLYSIIITVLAGRVADLIQEGPRGKAVIVISEKHEQIALWILEVLNRGVTRLAGYGAYTDTERPVLLVIVNRRQLVGLKMAVRKIDAGAFVIITDASEVMGEGFALPKQGKGKQK